MQISLGNTPLYGNVTGTAGTGFLEQSLSGVGFSSTYYETATSDLANIGFDKPTKSITTYYHDTIHMYARAYVMDAYYGTLSTTES